MPKTTTAISKPIGEANQSPAQLSIALSGLLGDVVHVSAVSLDLPASTPMDRWRTLATFFNSERLRDESIHWLLADWLCFGGEKFCERDTDGKFKLTPMFSRYQSVALQTGYEESTLRSYAGVSRAIPKEIRIPPQRLSFKHHRIVAALEHPDDQKRWLNEAEENGWSVSELTLNVRAWLAETDKQIALPLVGSDLLLSGFIPDLRRRINKLVSGQAIHDWPVEQRMAIRADVISLRDGTLRLCDDFLNLLDNKSSGPS